MGTVNSTGVLRELGLCGAQQPALVWSGSGKDKLGSRVRVRQTANSLQIALPANTLRGKGKQVERFRQKRSVAEARFS
jgi:hypothetical protein